MKKLRLLLLIISLLILLNSCSSYKENLIQIGYDKDAIMNAVLDFSNTSKLYKKGTVFKIMILNLNEEKLAVTIIKSGVKVLLKEKTKIGSKGLAPSRYIEKEGKLFFWWDDNYALTENMLLMLSKYNISQDDDDGFRLFPDFEIDESQKGVDYYFCKSNLLKYKKVTTNRAIGYYDAPKLDCKPH